MKSCALILALLGLLAPSACEKQETDPMNWVEWKTPMSAALDSIQVVAPVNAEIIFESHNSEDEPDIQVFGASCGYRLEFSSRKFNVDSISVSNQTDERMELTVTKTDLEVSRAPSSGPWWPAVLVAILSGFGLKGGLNFEGRGGLLCLALLSLWTLTLAACSENVTIKVSVPSSVCFNAVSDSGIDVWPCPSGNFQEDFLVEGEEGEASLQAKSECTNGKFLTVELKTDREAHETSWELWKNGRKINWGPPGNNNYADETSYIGEICLKERGQYEFKLKDKGGDGLCCKFGHGSISLKLPGKSLLSTSDVANMKSLHKKIFSVDLPGNSGGNTPGNSGGNMLPRDLLWLDAHNSRREKYIPTKLGKGYVRMEWSNGLKKDAQEYADWLALNKCRKGQNLVHAKTPDGKALPEGENLAKNRGTGSWGNEPDPGKVLGRWVEQERALPYPKNAHLTQVLWRASKYVGCGEGVKTYANSREVCRVQVCRYIRPGNCNVGTNWKTQAKLDDTPCGRKCPDEGC